MSLKIVVCVKQVPDPEGPPTSFTVDQDACRVEVTGLPPVISPFDENALEAALQIKDRVEAKITLLGLGESHSRAILLKAMATGADGAFLVEGKELCHQSLDSYQTASLLAAALRAVGDWDLVLTGRQAADTNAGQVGIGIGQVLDVPCITLARKVEVSESELTVERIMADGFEVVASRMPAVVTVSHEVGELRYPSLSAIKEAKKLPVTVLSMDDLPIEEPPGPLVEAVGIKAPSRERRCKVVKAEEPEEAGEKLAGLLVGEGVIT